MDEYKVYTQAQIREDEIWDYTVKKWGVEQAVDYITGLHNHFQKLADQSIPWKQLPPDNLSGAEVYISLYEKHYVVFRRLSSGIGIISILHHAMDFAERLAEDLRCLEE